MPALVFSRSSLTAAAVKDILGTPYFFSTLLRLLFFVLLRLLFFVYSSSCTTLLPLLRYFLYYATSSTAFLFLRFRFRLQEFGQHSLQRWIHFFQARLEF